MSDRSPSAAGRSSLPSASRAPKPGRRSDGAGLAVPEQLDHHGRAPRPADRAPTTSSSSSTMHERRTDLADGRAAVAEIATVVENEMPALRSAVAAHRDASQLGRPRHRRGWPRHSASCLTRARYGDDLARIKSHTTKIEQAVASTESVAPRDRHREGRGSHRERCGPGTRRSMTTSSTMSIAPLSSARRRHIDLALLRANIQGVDGAVRNGVRRAGRALVTTREVRHIRVAEVWSGPITSETSSTRRSAGSGRRCSAELDDDTEVRFR